MNNDSLKDIIVEGSIVEIKHNFMLNYVDATVFDIQENKCKIKLFDKFPDISFFMQDPVSLNITCSKKLFKLDGEILFIESLEPLVFVIEVNKISKQLAQRKNKRFFVSLACDAKYKNQSEPVFTIIKNISEQGFKLVSKKDIASVGEPIELCITLDKYNKLCCNVNIIRKTSNNDYFEFGTEIFDISDDNKKTLLNYLDLFNFDK